MHFLNSMYSYGIYSYRNYGGGGWEERGRRIDSPRTINHILSFFFYLWKSMI